MTAQALAVAKLDNLAADIPLTPQAADTGMTAAAATEMPVSSPPAEIPTRSLAQKIRDWRPVILPASFGLGFLALWQFLVWVTNYPPAILPAPSVVLQALYTNRDLLLSNIPPTAGVALGGFLIAAAAGVALAVAMTWSEYIKDALYPNIVAFQVIPKVAWAPMFILWLGIETPSRLGFATFIAIFPIIISMTTGLSNTDPSMLKLCRALTASKWQTLLYVRFPYSIPYLFSAMKISITLAMIGVIVGEFITSQDGLGFVILTAAGRQQADLMLASVFVLCLIGLVFYGFVALGTALVDRWFGH